MKVICGKCNAEKRFADTETVANVKQWFKFHTCKAKPYIRERGREKEKTTA